MCRAIVRRRTLHVCEKIQIDNKSIYADGSHLDWPRLQVEPKESNTLVDLINTCQRHNMQVLYPLKEKRRRQNKHGNVYQSTRPQATGCYLVPRLLSGSFKMPFSELGGHGHGAAFTEMTCWMRWHRQTEDVWLSWKTKFEAAEIHLMACPV